MPCHVRFCQQHSAAPSTSATTHSVVPLSQPHSHTHARTSSQIRLGQHASIGCQGHAEEVVNNGVNLSQPDSTHNLRELNGATATPPQRRKATKGGVHAKAEFSQSLAHCDSTLQVPQDTTTGRSYLESESRSPNKYSSCSSLYSAPRTMLAPVPTPSPSPSRPSDAAYMAVNMAAASSRSNERLLSVS